MGVQSYRADDEEVQNEWLNSQEAGAVSGLLAESYNSPGRSRDEHEAPMKPKAKPSRERPPGRGDKPAAEILFPTSKSLDRAVLGPIPAPRPAYSHRRPQSPRHGGGPVPGALGVQYQSDAGLSRVSSARCTCT